MIIDEMVPQLFLHEGCKLTPYKDTLGNWTVLVGYNVTARGWDYIEDLLGVKVQSEEPYTDVSFTRDQAIRVLRADISRLIKAVPTFFPGYNDLDEIRQRVVLDMAFNMGLKIRGFQDMIAGVAARDWSRAARAMYNSKWGEQVGEARGQRCDRLARMMLTGTAPTDIPAI